jgi:hypothetical protein
VVAAKPPPQKQYSYSTSPAVKRRERGSEKDSLKEDFFSTLFGEEKEAGG